MSDTFPKGKRGKPLTEYQQVVRRVMTWDKRKVARETLRLGIQWRDLWADRQLHERIAAALLKEQQEDHHA